MVLQVFSGSFGNMQVHAQNDADIWVGAGENIGMPWNASGLKEKYDVTEEEFQLVTTMAMQYWTDSYWGNKGSNYIHDNHEAFKIDSQRKRENKRLPVVLVNSSQIKKLCVS
ncbi:hypothetical protein XK27_02265 [Streptococcus suis]|nr:hypothetical protein XK27_02265 [Streptococcus suis]